MHFDLSAPQLTLRDRLHGVFTELCNDELREELSGPHRDGGGPRYWQALAKLSTDGWLGFGWPPEYGGQGAGPVEQMIFADECLRAGFPFPFLTVASVAPSLMRFGSASQRAEYLPRILAGEILFCLGYTEAEAGTDLAAMTTRAARLGDEWVISGQKMYTSLADISQYCWLAARTDPDGPKHAAISIFIVPMNSPGVAWTPVHVIGGRTNAVYLDEVRLPAAALVGGVGEGWGLMMDQLDQGRAALAPAGPHLRRIDEVTAWARTTALPAGGSVLDQPWVRRCLAEARAGAEVLKLMNWKQAWAMVEGELDPAVTAMVKVYGSEFAVRCHALLMQVLGPASLIKDGSPGAVLRGELESLHCDALVGTFGHGANEIQRDVIAMVGLGLGHHGVSR